MLRQIARVAACLSLKLSLGLGLIGAGAISSRVMAQQREIYPPMLTGQKLFELCGSRDQVKRFSCGYYVMGAVDTQLNNAGLFGENERRAKLCPPAGKTPEELVALVRAHLEQHPDERDKAAFVLIWDALRGEFACR